MSGAWRATSVAVCLLAGVACATFDEQLAAVLASPSALAREARLNDALTARDSAPSGSVPSDSSSVDETPIGKWLLPPGLQEISGLTLTRDGRLLVHNDELADVSEIDYRRGVLVKRFSFGKGLTGDFEGITVANDVVYMVSGTGMLYEFREGANGEEVEYTVHDTGLEKECQFEGIAFDSTMNALVLACKLIINKSLRDSLVLFRWSLAGGVAERLSRLAIPLASVIGANGWENVQPADITIDPLTGNYVLIASVSDEKGLISITPAGAVVFARPLPTRHHQPEGIAITKDGILIVSDEAATPPAMITLYRWR